MRETAEFAMTRQDDQDGSTKIATASLATNSVAPGQGDYAVGSRSLDNVAVWVNEGGAGGEVIR
jgi:hypothetical protein